jgi:hypothetical protein
MQQPAGGNVRVAHLWMLLDSSCLIPDAGLVHLRSDHLRQIKCVVDAGRRETLDLLRFSTAILVGALGVRSGSESDLPISGDGTRARGLVGGFLRASLGRRFLCGGRCLFLREQSLVRRFASEFRLAFLLAVLLGFGGSFTLYPFVRICSFLKRNRCALI